MVVQRRGKGIPDGEQHGKGTEVRPTRGPRAAGPNNPTSLLGRAAAASDQSDDHLRGQGNVTGACFTGEPRSE